jgi:hypothetical protein
VKTESARRWAAVRRRGVNVMGAIYFSFSCDEGGCAVLNTKWRCCREGSEWKSRELSRLID